MKEKLKCAAIRALWTFVQTAVGIFGTKAVMTGDFTTNVWAVLAPSLTAAALSFAKSMGVGMPEVDYEDMKTDGEVEVTIPPTPNATPFVTGGVRWNPNFNLKDRLDKNDPVIVLSVKRNFEANKERYRQLRL